jgi:hypothetical protein
MYSIHVRGRCKGRKVSRSAVKKKSDWSIPSLKKRRKSVTNMRKSPSTNPKNSCVNNPSADASEYNNLGYRVNYNKYNLSRDIEKNPRPVIVPSKTICAPYSQGNVALFGSNAGSQRVAISLCALIYNCRNGVKIK